MTRVMRVMSAHANAGAVLDAHATWSCSKIGDYHYPLPRHLVTVVGLKWLSGILISLHSLITSSNVCLYNHTTEGSWSLVFYYTKDLFHNVCWYLRSPFFPCVVSLQMELLWQQKKVLCGIGNTEELFHTPIALLTWKL